MIKVLIVDDEPSARENLMIRLSSRKNLQVCGQADNGHDALTLAVQLQPDVIFLDIKMPGLNGLDAAKSIKAICNAKVIFVTAFDQFALQAIQENALDYLVKPINDSFFDQAISRIETFINTREKLSKIEQQANLPSYLKRLNIRDGYSITMVNVNAIESIEAAGDYLCIQANGQNHIHRQSMKELITLLDPSVFIRIHRSHAVNINYVERLQASGDGYVLELSDGKSLPISRRYQKTVRQKLR